MHNHLKRPNALGALHHDQQSSANSINNVEQKKCHAFCHH
jgi:hypothetical protein